MGNVIEKSYRSKQVMTADYLAEGKIPIIDQSRDFIAGYTDDEETLVSLGKPVIVFGDHTRVLKYIVSMDKPDELNGKRDLATLNIVTSWSIS